MRVWERLMYNITPYYAVKCNPDKMLVRKLASIGANFDCASPAEIDIVLEQGVSPSRILYANPCKRLCDISYAFSKGVTMTTFDSVTELQKIREVAPDMKVILRIYANDPTAQCVLSNKFGAKESEWVHLIDMAKSLALNLCGISFHVGSGASNPEAFSHAIQHAHTLYDLASSYGFDIGIIDIGGGFSSTSLGRIAPVVQTAIDKYFSFPSECQIIAEPGRYFAQTCATLYTRVIGLREGCCTITDGLYGSFNNIVYDHAVTAPPIVLSKNGAPKTAVHDQTMQETTIFGPTCDGFDTVMTCYIPQVDVGDYLVFKHMGAYTIAGACNFNGIQFMTPTVYYM